MEHADCIVIGAGLVGLAIARALSPYQQVIVVEQHPLACSETSSRNSSVIHAGIYYPSNTLKASLCIEGRQALYHYCQEHDIAHQRCGKLILAQNDEEIIALKALQEQAIRNGVSDLHFCDAKELSQREADVRAKAGLLSPNTGIIDTHAYAQQLMRDIEQKNSHIVYKQRVTHIEHIATGFVLTLNDSDTLHCNTLVNAAGLHAQQLATFISPAHLIPAVHYVKGHYFSYHGKHSIKHLLYPMPSSHLTGLGIHATLGIHGELRFGPDTLSIEQVDYQFAATSAHFIHAIERYFPTLDSTQLKPDFTGIRPKIAGNGFSDFHIHGPNIHGITNYVQLFGIESPGLTASLAIGSYVHQLLHSANP